MREVNTGERFRMRLWRADDARYEFTAPIVALEKEPPALVFSHVFATRRIQNRAHFRVPFHRAAHIDFYSVPEHEEQAALAWIYAHEPLISLHGTFTNLSAGGFAAVMPQAPPPKAYARVRLALDDAVLDMAARVVGTVPLSDRRCLIRVAFHELTEEQEEAVSQYVFRRQRAEQQSHAEGGNA